MNRLQNNGHICIYNAEPWHIVLLVIANKKVLYDDFKKDTIVILRVGNVSYVVVKVS